MDKAPKSGKVGFGAAVSKFLQVGVAGGLPGAEMDEATPLC